MHLCDMNLKSRVAVAPRLVGAVVALACGLAVVGWFDYRATRHDLLSLLVEQAAALRQAVAAAARSAGAAAAQAQASLASRLLDNARFIDRLDRGGQLDARTLERIAAEHRLFRISVVDERGLRVLSAGIGGPPAGAGRGFGPGPGGGVGAGMGGALVDRLLRGGDREAVSEVHGSRWGRGWRLSAGIRRTRGGAIVLNVDADSLAELGQQASLDHVLADIASGVDEVAYVVMADGDTRALHGPLAQAATAATDVPDGVEPLWRDEAGRLSAYERVIAGVPVVEFSGPVDPSIPGGAVLRMGLSLQVLRGAERRALTRLVLSSASALGLGALVIAFVGLRREHGALREQHARVQEALRRRDRLAAMGELASTVAHEVRNPLNAIGMSVQRLRREFLDAVPAASTADRAEQRELLEVLASETARIERIVRQFLDYARPPRLVPTVVDVREVLTSAVSAVDAMGAARGVQVGLEGSPDGEAIVDPDQFRQALDNLLRNAIDASPAGARVVVSGVRDADAWRITIEDAGPGIPPDLLPRIFDLYFTTKADGTGVGLAVTHQIIDAHGGTIDVDSEVGRGTRMTLVMPVRRDGGDHA